MATSDRAPGALERTVENLVTVLASFLPRMSGRTLHAGPVDALIAFAAYVGLAVLAHLAIYSRAILDFRAVAEIAGTAVFGIALATLMLLALRRGHESAGLTVGLLWALALGSALAVALYLAFDVRTLADWILFGVLPAFLPVAVLLLARLGPLKGVLVTLAVALPGLSGALEEIWWNLANQSSGSETAAVLPDTEMIYAVQRDLLDAQVKLKPADPEQTEMFAVLGAGYAYEGVFAREVMAVGTFLEEQMGAGDRVVRLVNDDAAPTAFPLMNRVNLRRALKKTGNAMDSDDVLFLFLTSHGGPGVLSTQFQSVISRDIGPEDIAGALDEAGIGHAIIVISACYSGSFVEALAAPERLILTAARADRTSFGCSDASEWTEWGRAFFVDAWPETPDPRLAAKRAQEIVAAREAERKIEASHPQIVEGEAIGAVIDRWLATLE